MGRDHAPKTLNRAGVRPLLGDDGKPDADRVGDRARTVDHPPASTARDGRQ